MLTVPVIRHRDDTGACPLQQLPPRLERRLVLEWRRYLLFVAGNYLLRKDPPARSRQYAICLRYPGLYLHRHPGSFVIFDRAVVHAGRNRGRQLRQCRSVVGAQACDTERGPQAGYTAPPPASRSCTQGLPSSKASDTRMRYTTGQEANCCIFRGATRSIDDCKMITMMLRIGGAMTTAHARR